MGCKDKLQNSRVSTTASTSTKQRVPPDGASYSSRNVWAAPVTLKPLKRTSVTGRAALPRSSTSVCSRGASTRARWSSASVNPAGGIRESSPVLSSRYHSPSSSSSSKIPSMYMAPQPLLPLASWFPPRLKRRHGAEGEQSPWRTVEPPPVSIPATSKAQPPHPAACTHAGGPPPRLTHHTQHAPDSLITLVRTWVQHSHDRAFDGVSPPTP